jgi:hypothetical protein
LGHFIGGTLAIEFKSAQVIGYLPALPAVAVLPGALDQFDLVTFRCVNESNFAAAT